MKHTMYDVQSDQSPDFHSLSAYWLQVSKYFVGTASGPNEFLKPFAQMLSIECWTLEENLQSEQILVFVSTKLSVIDL